MESNVHHPKELHPTASPYRRIGKKAGLCHENCSECDCSAQVSLALRNRTEDPRDLMLLAELPADILALILEVARHE